MCQNFTFSSNLILNHFDFVSAGDEENIDDFENAESVQDEKGDEPIFLSQFGGFPESETFPNKRPNY